MDWLKDKKNLPIVVGLAVFVLLAAGGLIALENGWIGGTPAATTAVVTPARSMQPPVSQPTPPTPTASLGTRPVALGSAPPAAKTAPVAPTALAASKLINPAVGPDPFGIPGGQQRLARQLNGILNAPAGVIPVRERIPVYNLFTLHPPPPPPPVSGPAYEPGAQDYRLTGIENSDGGILAILETSGQSQTVKPGDVLPDGGKVLSIQTTSITLRNPGGSTVTVPLSSGAGPAGQTQNGQYPNPENYPQPGQNGTFPPMPGQNGTFPPVPGE